MNDVAPHWIRHGVVVAPFYVVTLVLCGLAVLMPRPVGAWVAGVGLLAAEVQFLASYRVPAVFMSGWLREEIEKGETPVARPTRLDWLLFWVVVPVAVLGDLAFPILIVVYHGAG